METPDLSALLTLFRASRIGSIRISDITLTFNSPTLETPPHRPPQEEFLAPADPTPALTPNELLFWSAPTLDEIANASD
jgi:hypothetical protein